MVPHGGYTVTNSPTRYAYPAPSHDIRSSRGAVFALQNSKPGGAAKLRKEIRNKDVTTVERLLQPTTSFLSRTLKQPRIMASNDVPYCLEHGIAPGKTKAITLVRLLGDEIEDPTLAPRIQQYLLQPHGIVSVADLKECPKAEVITRITSATAAAYAMGMVLMLKRYIFSPTEDCERIIPTRTPTCRLGLYPHPCRLRCKCRNDAVCRRRA